MAIFVFSPDDDVVVRERIYKITRDNVLFEAGMFLGMQGKDRTFIITPRDVESFHIPTDLVGITTAAYEPDQLKKDVHSALAPAIAKIRLAIRTTSWAMRRLHIRKDPAKMTPGIFYPLKIYLTITNSQEIRVLVQADGFEFGKDVHCHLAAHTRWDGRYDFKFYMGKDPADPRKELYAPECFLEPRQEIRAWIPVDDSIGEKRLAELYAKNAAGVLHYRTIWLGDVPTAQLCEEAL
jgi:hypothetical protein